MAENHFRQLCPAIISISIQVADMHGSLTVQSAVRAGVPAVFHCAEIMNSIQIVSVCSAVTKDSAVSSCLTSCTGVLTSCGL